MKAIDINTGASTVRRGFPTANIKPASSNPIIGNTQMIPTVESTLTIRAPQSPVNPAGQTPNKPNLQKAQQYEQGLTGILNATSTYGMDSRSFPTVNQPFKFQ